jgi:gas vesicle protein
MFMAKDRKNSFLFISGIILGAAVGATLGVLFAPDEGKVTRRRLEKKGRKALKDLEKTAKKAGRKLEPAIENVKKGMEGRVDEIRREISKGGKSTKK